MTLPRRRLACPSLLVALLLLALPLAAAAQDPEETPLPWVGYDRPQLSIVAGLIQPVLLGGGNVEMDLHFRRLVVGYSHGFDLKLEGDTVVGEASEQGLALKLPFSTGFGVGLRVFEWLDVRLEGKVHHYEVREENAQEPSFDYTTLTLGTGAYIRYRPLYHFGLGASTPAWTHGIVLALSARFWPNIWTSLKDDAIAYDNATTASREVHQAQNVGIANTPFVGNLGLGYMITF